MSRKFVPITEDELRIKIDDAVAATPNPDPNPVYDCDGDKLINLVTEDSQLKKDLDKVDFDFEN